MDIGRWLQGLGLERYAGAFAANDVDADTVRVLTEADLLDIGITSMGHRRKLLAAIASLGRGGVLASRPADGPGPNAERRQLSVLYCDLVGSTAMSQRMDSEDYRELIRTFYAACRERIALYDGWVANFIGDCVLAYFGWPRAHEDDVERAVRAALDLVRTTGALRLPDGTFMAVRLGIATGMVVVGDLIRDGPAQEQSAVGVTPNLAARLQSLAAPGQVVIDELTRRLLGSGFTVNPLGEHLVKGLAWPVAAFVASGERTLDNRFDAHRAQELAPMVGRVQELALLMERWALAQSGEGQTVLLLGEAGIGKSRLVRAMLDACTARPHRLVRWQCSPYHTGSALWPVIQRLGRTAGLLEGESTDSALDKLEGVATNAQTSAMYATLLGLNGAQRYGPLQMSSQMLRERTLELLVDELLEAAEQEPLLLVLEDAHWIDPTTLELIGRCLEAVDTTRLLILISSRPDNQPALAAHPNVTRLSLNRLSRASVDAMVSNTAGKALTSRARATIVAQSDGVPLFVEELTKAVLETGGAAIPASLHGSLMARLDRIPEVKGVAQTAACIGREFDLALLQAAAVQPEMVASALDKLVAAQLVFRRDDRANPRYIFKHALVQEAAYTSLLRTDRQAIHARILQVLQNGQVRAPYEILARHAEGARQFDRAIAYWSEAGDAATAKSAYAEAAGFLDAAIALIQAQNDGVDRCAQEIELQLRLGHVRVATEGYGGPTTLVAFERAQDLLAAAPRSPAHEMRVQYGLWAWHHTCGNFKEHMLAAERLFAAARVCGDTASRGMGHRVLAGSLLYAGDFARARHHLEEALALLDASHNEPVVVTQFGVNPEVAIHFYLGWTLCILGFDARSRDMLRRSRQIAGSLPQVNARALAHMHCGLAGVCAGDVDSVRSDGESLAELGARHRMPMYRGYSDAFAGWVALESLQSPQDAVSLLERGLTTLAQIGSRNYVVLFIAHLARALAACGRYDEAASIMADSLIESQSRGIGWCDAELWRLRGELLLQGPRPAHLEAAGFFEKAVELASMRGAKLWELRAAHSLARLRAEGIRPINAARSCGPNSVAGSD